MRRILIAILLGAGLATGWAQEQEYMMSKAPLSLYLKTQPELTASDKDLLCSSLEEAGDGDNFLTLALDSRVRVMRRSRFVQRQTVYDRENSTSSTVERLFKIALVEVMEGQSKGRIGWVVVSYRASGEDPVVYLTDI